VFKNPEAGEDILNQVTEFRAKEAQVLHEMGAGLRPLGQFWVYFAPNESRLSELHSIGGELSSRLVKHSE
jgi:hypothetical protein